MINLERRDRDFNWKSIPVRLYTETSKRPMDSRRSNDESMRQCVKNSVTNMEFRR
jgi:hypothetical protein